MAISERLRQYMQRFGSQTDFIKRFEIPRSTLRSWTHRRKPAVPEPAYLLAMARDGNLNVNWLLFGDGPELRHRDTSTPKGGVTAAIAAELQATEKADKADHEQAWARLALYGPNALFQLAVEAVRPVYQEALRDLDYAQMTAHNLVQAYRAVLAESGKLSDDEIRRRLLTFRAEAVAAQLSIPPRPFVFHPVRLAPAEELGRAPS